jgi:hypothetical protein
MEAYLVDERQAALNSIVGLRNDIAHGGGAGVSLAQVVTYWTHIQAVVEHMADIVLAPARRPAAVRRTGRA